MAAPDDPGPFTIGSALSAPAFFIAHRGSGDNWPEHTMLAYSEAAASGLKAIEVSVSSTADGVLVCHHDLNTLRLTGIDLTIPRASYAALQSLSNDARAWLGPNAPLEPIPLLADVLDKFAATHVIFLEDKPGTNADELLALLERYPGSREHIVWKQPATSPGHAVAKAAGYTTWGYLTSRDFPALDNLIPKVDLLGVHHNAPDDVVRQLVGSGKPVIAWEVHRRSEVEHLRGLGVWGFMCSNIRHVLQLEPPRSEDSFDTGLRGTGDLPWQADGVWDEQPSFRDGAIRISSAEKASYLLGSMGGSTARQWELDFELRWPERLPSGGAGAGMAFGLATDAPFRPGTPSDVAGYWLDYRADGTLILNRHDRGGPEEVELGRTESRRPAPGDWMRLTISLIPRGIAVSFPEGQAQGSAIQSADTAHGGTWFALLKNYDGGPPVEFRNVLIRDLPEGESCSSVG
jgi:glycerophosphoryl diester phosphodiesterase